ncbi:MAG TPA: aconitase family protein [Burkholderiaceae bacterium]|nr:aconitase family protein [Burkholderiaceae bacterium]
MSSTIAEKILARAAGRQALRAGDELLVRPDFVLAYELRGYTDVYFRDMQSFGVRGLARPERFAIFIDHRIPAKTPDDEKLHVDTRAWCAEHGVPLFDRVGIGHQVAAEAGYAVPGSFSVHFDGHISQLGAFGALAMGLRSDVFEAFVRDGVSLRVPESIRVRLHGRPGPGVMARDVFHHLLYRHGSRFAAFRVLEYAGDGLDALSVEGLQVLTGLAMFVGAVTAIVPPGRGRRAAQAQAAPRVQVPPMWPDHDARYAGTLDVDLADVEPMVVLPPSPANAAPLARHAGLPVDAGYLGSCASGRLEDLHAAAAILRGRKVAPGFSLHVVPTSQAIMAAAAADGTLTTLIEAGAFVSSPSCDFCSGNIATLAPGQRAVSTGTLNVPGRMGATDADIYLCSAATVAASALEGRLCDPRRFAGQAGAGAGRP